VLFFGLFLLIFGLFSVDLPLKRLNYAIFWYFLLFFSFFFIVPPGNFSADALIYYRCGRPFDALDADAESYDYTQFLKTYIFRPLEIPKGSYSIQVNIPCPVVEVNVSLVCKLIVP